jgi:CBS domain-containing protein
MEESMQVNELMAGPVDSCGPEMTLTEAARRMTKDDVGSLAVTHEGALIGIVTERDVVRAVAEGKHLAHTSVGEVMTPEPDSLEPDVSIEDAASWMLAAGYRHLPVVEADRVLGMVSMKDLMWALTERSRGR